MIPKNKNTVNKSRLDRIYHIFTKSIILVLFPVMFLHLTLTNANDPATGMKMSFQPGEKLTYKGTWGIIPAGELSLEILPKEIFNGIEAYHFVMLTKTSSAVDLIYRVRERQDSYVDIGVTHSIFYKKKTESPHPRDETIKFNWAKMEMTYTNFGQSKPPTPVAPGTFDPLAFFYAIRLRTLKENSVIRLPLTDGNNLSIEVIINIGKKTVIDIEGILYDTIEVTPNIIMLEKLGNVVKKSDRPQLIIWVTADEKKIPVRIRSKVGIISFDFDLVSDPQ